MMTNPNEAWSTIVNHVSKCFSDYIIFTDYDDSLIRICKEGRKTLTLRWLLDDDKHTLMTFVQEEDTELLKKRIESGFLTDEESSMDVVLDKLTELSIYWETQK